VTRPKAIFFDIGNVLVRLRTEQFLDGMARACDARWERHSILASIREKEGPHVDYEKGRIDGPAFHAHLQGRFGLSLDYGAWLSLWNNYFEPNRPMEALLARLRGQVRFFGLSNTNAEHLAHLKRNFRLFDGFERVIASNEVGARKPEQAIFEAALGAAGLEAGEALYLDDLEPFILEARRRGWQGFHYTFNDADLRQALETLGFELPSLDGRSSTAAC
jgi:putative hydrolase of the HAD superfamily